MSNIFDDMTGGDAKVQPENETNDNADIASAVNTSSAPYTSRDIKGAVQDLLKFGLLEADRKPNHYRTVTTQHTRIDEILEPLDLRLRIDDVRGLAFLVVTGNLFDGAADSDATEDGWNHPLVRRQRLTLEQSLLVAILRQMYLAHEQEAGVGAGGAAVSLDELSSSLQVYISSSGSDARDEKRLRTLLEALRTHGIVSEIDEKNQVIVRPIITHLADPASLQSLLEHFLRLADSDDRDAAS